MTLRFCSIASGSSGNCIYVGNDDSGLLVDAGISCKGILESLKNIGVCNSSIKGILVTHEHSDHIKSIGAMSRKLNMPIYANCKTWEALDGSVGKVKAENIRIFDTNKGFYIDDIYVSPFSISHDAADPVGYTFSFGSKKVGLATDLGYFSQTVREALKGSAFVMLEANHDIEMLKVGSYPYFLKRRILGEQGHLSNEASGYAACELVDLGVKQIMLGHLSKENNFPQLAYETVKGILEQKGIAVQRDVTLDVAPRSSISKVFSV
ncbi:MBL fold metallo-hydrolase [Lutispora thermophila]|uniref:Phosphoribosyl 1,2-cyclic phosphodiesterase n=1 Tax=Lutispora thermophila DSM 19022 TaxID=1122184 RepID=A0A1M6GVZ4_9FIRM|nr:MBL fold metallo-hydrolase [Lutispora thermophila]SHJ14123.1 Phosphoribosyl 1,2-cyclic phosphodiesterase [Lutispora thermophila DSM 19022]